jgi:hypothetical protein
VHFDAQDLVVVGDGEIPSHSRDQTRRTPTRAATRREKVTIHTQSRENGLTNSPGFERERGRKIVPTKRDIPGGFKVSPLHVNSGLGTTQRWDEAAIKQRAKKWASIALGIWSAPRLDESVLQKYGCRNTGASAYSIEYPVAANMINMLSINLQVIDRLRSGAGEFLVDPVDVAREGLESLADLQLIMQPCFCKFVLDR